MDSGSGIIIPPKKNSISDPDSVRSVDLDQDSDSGFGFWIPESDSGSGFRIRITDSDSGFWISDSDYRFVFLIRNPDLHFGFRIRIQDLYQNVALGISVADPNPDPPVPRVLSLLDPDTLVRGMDPDPDLDPSIVKQK